MNRFKDGFFWGSKGDQGALVNRPVPMDRAEYPMGTIPVNIGAVVMDSNLSARSDEICTSVIGQEEAGKTANSLAVSVIASPVKDILDDLNTHLKDYTTIEGAAGKASSRIRDVVEKVLSFILFPHIVASGGILRGELAQEDIEQFIRDASEYRNSELQKVPDNIFNELSVSLGLPRGFKLKESLKTAQGVKELLKKVQWLNKGVNTKPLSDFFTDLQKKLTQYGDTLTVGTDLYRILIRPIGTTSKVEFSVGIPGVDPALIAPAAFVASLVKSALDDADKEKAELEAGIQSDKNTSASVKKQKSEQLNIEFERKKNDIRAKLGLLSSVYVLVRICDETNVNLRVRTKVLKEYSETEEKEKALGRSRVSLSLKRDKSTTLSLLREKTYKEKMEPEWNKVKSASKEDQVAKLGSSNIQGFVLGFNEFYNSGDKYLQEVSRLRDSGDEQGAQNFENSLILAAEFKTQAGFSATTI